MARPWLLLAVLSLTGAGLAGCSEGNVEQAQAALVAANLTLAGVVVDEALRPVAGANVTAGGELSNVTGADGTFSFADLEPGVYVVKASRAGYADATTQAILAETQESPLVKLVLIRDVTSLAFVEVFAIDGFVECGVYFIVGYFAACSGPNTVSAIACPATGVCLGNLTGDRSLILQPIGRSPQWLQMEAVWEATTATSEVMMVQSGATNEERVAVGELTILNETVGPSPNLNIVAGKLLEDQKFGTESTLVYMRLHTAPNPPTGAGFAAQQPFKLVMHMFYGYIPTLGWRFSVDPVPPAPL